MRNNSFVLNTRLLAALLALCAAAGVGVYFLHQYQVQRQAGFYLEQAQEARKAIAPLKTPAEQVEQLKTALNLYAQYSARMPEDLDAQTECALMLVETGQTLAKAGLMIPARSALSEGLAHIKAILLKDRDRRDLRRKLIETQYAFGMWSETIADIKLLCQGPTDADALREFLDGEGLWERLDALTGGSNPGARRLNVLLESDGQTVDRDKLLKFLGDEFWRLLDDGDLLEIYATCRINLNQPEGAEKPLEKAITLAKHDLDVYDRLAKLLVDQKRPQDADYWMSEMLLANADSFRACQLRASYRLRRIQTGDRESAEMLARGAMADALASIHKAAEQALEKADQAAPSNPATAALKKTFDRVRAAAPRKPDDAAGPEYRAALLDAVRETAALRKAIPPLDEQLEGMRDGLILAAQSALEMEGLVKPDKTAPWDEARTLAAVAAEIAPTFPSVYLTLSFIAQRTGQPEEALRCLRQGRERTDGNEIILWQLAGLLLRTGKNDEAATIVKELESRGASKTFVTELKAEIDLARGNWLAAATQFEEVLPQLVDWPLQARHVNLMLAECYGNLGRIDEQRTAYLQASSSDRSWLPGLLGLARSKAASGQIEEALEDYRAIVRYKQAPLGAWIELGRLLLARNLQQPKSERDWREFEDALAHVGESAPGVVETLRAEMLCARDKPDEAVSMLTATREKLHKAIEEAQAKRQSLLAEAETLAGDAKTQKQNEAAQAGAQATVHKNGLSAVWLMLVGIKQRQEDWAAVETALASAREDLGDTLALRVARGRYLLSRYTRDAAPKLRELAEGTDAFSPRMRVELWQSLASLAAGAGDDEQVDRLARRILEVEPGNLDAYKLRFQAAVHGRDTTLMRQILDEVKRLEKTPSAFWCYGEAVRLSELASKERDDKLLREAQKLLVQAAHLQPNSAGVHLLAAQLHERLKEPDAAVEKYIAAVDTGIRQPEVVQHVAQLLARQGRFRDADRLFRLIGETQGDLSGDLSRQMRSVKTRLGEFEEALDVARKVAKDSNDFADHVCLGQLLTVMGKQMDNNGRHDEAKTLLEEAEKAFKEAIGRKMDEPQAWVALIQFYSQTNRMDKAEAAIRQAERRLPTSESTGALAECYEVLGRFDKAASQYALALRNAPKDPAVAQRAATFYLRIGRLEEAETQFRRIVDGDLAAVVDESQRAWARRALALGLFARGGPKERAAALDWIKQNLQANPNSVEDQSARAIMLASDSSGQRRLEAIKLFEDFLATQRYVDPEAQFLLAKLLLAEDRWSQYKTLMRRLLRDHAGVSRYVMHFAEALLLRDELEEADTWIKELTTLAPDSPYTTRLRADLAFRRQQYESLLALIQQWTGSGPMRAQRLPVAAGLIESFAKRLRETGRATAGAELTTEAQKLYQEFVDLQPGRQLLMAEFLAKQGRLDEAIAVLDREWPNADPRAIAQTCFNIVDGADASAEQLLRVEKIVRQALPKHDNAIPLRFAQAMLRDYQDRFEEAEQIYRDILKESPDDINTLNALAVLLAQEGVKLDEASRLIDRAIGNATPSPTLLDSRATVELALGNTEQALEDLRRAIQEAPNAIRYFHQARVYHELGKKKPAIDALRRAHELGLTEKGLPLRERRAYRRLKIALE